MKQKKRDQGFVDTQEQLAGVLGIDRKTIGNVIRRYPKLLPGKKRGAESDGRYAIAPWRDLLDSLGIRGRGQNRPDLDDERAIRLALLQLDLDRRRFDFERERDRMLPAAQFEAALFRTFAALHAAITAFGPRINEKLEGLTFHDRALVLEQESDLLRKTIASCDYLEPKAEDEV